MADVPFHTSKHLLAIGPRSTFATRGVDLNVNSQKPMLLNKAYASQLINQLG